MDVKCPQCGGDNTQRLPLLFESGSKTPVFTPDAKASNGGLRPQSALVQKLAPPQKPVDPRAIAGGIGCLAWLILSGGTAAIIAALIYGPEITPENENGRTAISAICMVAWIVILAIIALRYVAPGVNRRRAEIEQQHSEALALWNHMFYCHRCGHQFPIEPDRS